MFTFVKHPEVSSNNNTAEGSLSPRCVARNIRSGTRSPFASERCLFFLVFMALGKLLVPSPA